MLDTLRKTARDLVKRSRSAQEELRSGLEGVRKDVRRLKDEIEATRFKPCTLDVAKKRASDVVADTVALIRSPQNAERFASVQQYTEAPAMAAMRSVNDRLPPHQRRMDMVFAFAAPAMVKAMHDELDALYATQKGINEDDRAVQLERLERELLDLELVEESIIRNGEAAGFPIDRRADANPAAVLAAEEALP